MHRQDSDEVTIHDASAYFSDEEWKRLQEWQKELYRNVMKEIHKALISLGPLIAATVCTARAKEKEEPQPIDNQDSAKRYKINKSTSDRVADPGVTLKTTYKEPLQLKSPEDSERRQSKACVSAEDPVSIFIDHLGEEIGEKSTNPTSEYETTEFEVVSFRITDEEEACFMDSQDRKGKKKRDRSPLGDESMNRKKKVGDSITCSERTPPCKSSTGKIKAEVLKIKEENSRSQMWSEGYQELKEAKTAESESSVINSVHFNLRQLNHNIGGSDKYNKCESDVCSSQLPKDLPNTKQNQGTYICTEGEKSCSLKAELTRPMKTNNSREKQYACTECEKSFFDRSQLITHYRTHSGEKPYMCTYCHKRFNRKSYLGEHVRIHTGERPYKCTECEKCFIQKSHLNEHQRKHICSKTAKTAIKEEHP